MVAKSGLVRWNEKDVSETGTQGFVSLTRDSISFSCLPSFVCQRGSLRSSSCQQHRDELGHVLIILIHRSWPATAAHRGGGRLLRKGKGGEDTRCLPGTCCTLDGCICYSAFHFWVNILSGIRRISKYRLAFDTRALPITNLSLAALDSAFGRDLHQKPWSFQ